MIVSVFMVFMIVKPDNGSKHKKRAQVFLERTP